jgi:hypothetical protein
MTITHHLLCLLIDAPAFWSADWVWGCPLILLTVIIHVLSLGFINQRAIRAYSRFMERSHPIAAFAVVMGVTTLLATLLHAAEAAIWALAYCEISSLADWRSAMLYSLGAMTTYGHPSLVLGAEWQLLGAIEALNGWLLFGLTTASLFWLIQQVSPRYRTEHE